MRSNIRNTSFVIGIVLSCAYPTLALVALTMQAHSLNAPSSRRIIGYQCKNPVCGKVFANLFAYDQHRNHATKAETLCASLTIRVELTGVRRVDRPIPDLHARPSTGLNGANSAKCMLMRNHCGCCSASTQSDEHVAVCNLDELGHALNSAK
jgi:hypothetical protein